MKWYVAVSGNIGTGKSSMTTLLSEKAVWRPCYEVVDENPYLSGVYGNMPRWSFHLQVFFLSQPFQHRQQILDASTSVIQDRTIYEDADIFARNLYLHRLMDERDFRNYYELFTTMVQPCALPTSSFTSTRQYPRYSSASAGGVVTLNSAFRLTISSS